MSDHERQTERSIAHLRIARPTNNLDAVVDFYRDGLGFEVLGRFDNHDGFDGVMLDHHGAGYYLEFTRQKGHTAGRAPSEEHLLVFDLPGAEAWQRAVWRIEALRHAPGPDDVVDQFDKPDRYSCCYCFSMATAKNDTPAPPKA